MYEYGPVCERSVNAEALTKVNALNVFVVDDLVGGAGHQNLAVVQDVGAVDDL